MAARRPSEYGATGSNIISRSKTITLCILTIDTFDIRFYSGGIYFIESRVSIDHHKFRGQKKRKGKSFVIFRATFSFYTRGIIIATIFLLQFHVERADIDVSKMEETREREREMEKMRKERNNQAIRAGQFWLKLFSCKIRVEGGREREVNEG